MFGLLSIAFLKSIPMKAPSLALLMICLATGIANAQNVYDARQSVLLEAVVEDNPPAIVLHWVLDTANGGYTLWRKSLSDSVWTDSLAILDSASTSWRDTAVNIGEGYEYQVIKSLPAFPTGEGGINTGAGYIYAGIGLPPVHHRGACLVIVDSTFRQTLAPELARLEADIEADGWTTFLHYVDRNDRIEDVKAAIVSWAGEQHDAQLALFLFGRVPVPYSGDIAPDGHQSDHRGAWPCDGYYADLDGVWTDETVNNTTAASSRNDNRPNDGKFDQSKFPSLIDLQVGRVDFANMDKFPESEEQLLRRYLDKDHAWRTGKVPVTMRGLVDNNFGASPEGLGQTGWRNFTAMFGAAEVKDLPYRQTLSAQSYIWSYGCGGGGPESASDISSTTNFVTDSLQTIFTMLFGSYFGDWDYPNDFLRGAIASRTCLASTWGNRPNWIMHHMALGEHIGYATQMTMNNRGLYHPRFYGDYVHTALMGDPTLRMHIHPPVENLSASQDGLNVKLEWTDPASSVGYFIYKKSATDTAYLLLNQDPLTGLTYLDKCVEDGMIDYMVRSVALTSSGSGTYFNLSAGVSVSILSDPAPFYTDAEVTNADPGQSNGSIILQPQGGCSPYTYSWDTGQISGSIQGLVPGTYCVTISDCVGCIQMYCATVDVTSSLSIMPGLIYYNLYPNPAHDQFALQLRLEKFQELSLDLIDGLGKVHDHRQVSGKDVELRWEVSALPAGHYWLRVAGVDGSVMIPFARAGE
jgi:hypothetical protein